MNSTGRTEIQSLRIRINPDYIRKHGFDPKKQRALDLPVEALEFFWETTKRVANVYEAKRERTPDQRIVRRGTTMYPGMTMDKRTGVVYHVFEQAVTPVDQIKAALLARRQEAQEKSK